jgi:hypothetical protein
MMLTKIRYEKLFQYYLHVYRRLFMILNCHNLSIFFLHYIYTVYIRMYEQLTNSIEQSYSYRGRRGRDRMVV